MNSWIIAGTALGYLILLSIIAWLAEASRKKGKSRINNSTVFALSMAVYCTAWTYYGSVGRAATNGLDFLTIYLGPTIMCALFWPVLRKIIRICRTQRINSIADLISTRYGKNFSLAVIVTIFCVLGVVPYIALQLKAISTSFDLLTGNNSTSNSIWKDSNFYGTLLLTAFILYFGTRSVDASEKHEGLVAAIAFESVIKLIAFLAAGLFITYGMFDGFTDIFRQASQNDQLHKLFVLDNSSSNTSWFSMLALSFFAIIFLPRQFQVNVVENLNEKHLNKAAWLFPLYLFIINLFVLPIALGGSILYPNNSGNADLFVLSLPLSQGQYALSLFIFIGGFSAATGMIIVETIALTTMISNNLAMPLLLSGRYLQNRSDGSLRIIVLWIRRCSILLVIGLALLYDKAVAQQYSLVSIGLVSFAAVAQLAPAVLGGIYWKGASKNGALAGLTAGFFCWMLTLLFPSLAGAGLLNTDFIETGFFGQSWLKPTALFGLETLDPVSHSLFWSLFLNTGLFVLVSIQSRKGIQEIYQGEVFVDVFKQENRIKERAVWKDNASLPALRSLLQNFIGPDKAGDLLEQYAQQHQLSLQSPRADPRLVTFTEKILAGIIGSASAHILVSRVAHAEELSMEEVINMLRESQEIRELNRQLIEMDEVKDEFLYTVTHELRTPLTSIRALTELVHDNQDMPPTQQLQFLSAVIRETERLSFLITQVLNLERYESGKHVLRYSSIHLNELISQVMESVLPLSIEKNLTIKPTYSAPEIMVDCDPHLLHQVLYNLLTNAIKFSPKNGLIGLSIKQDDQQISVSITDEGKGIAPESIDLIFDKFYQVPNQTLTKPEGSGLGLAISKKIIELHKGKIQVFNGTEGGAIFIFTLPRVTNLNLNGS